MLVSDTTLEHLNPNANMVWMEAYPTFLVQYQCGITKLILCKFAADNTFTLTEIYKIVRLSND